MKFPQSYRLISTAVFVSILAMGVSSQAFASEGKSSKTYKVSVTNISRGVQFTPILSATHQPSVGFFELGERPSDALAALAEGGDVSILKGLLDNELSNQVSATAVAMGELGGALLAPGATVEFEITTSGRSRYLSMASMLLPTNDSFMALDTVWLPTWGSRSYYAKGYDAGSEENDEICANIPGPTCGGNGAFDGIDDNAEGFVHISGGIHGEGDISSKKYDWRNPVALVKITRKR